MLATLAVALATFMNVLDSSIANVAIPTIAGNLGVSVDEGTWVITLFAAANADLDSADRLAHAARRPDQAVRLRDPAVRDFVVAVRHRAEPAGAARRAHFAGRRRGAADSAVAGDPARLVSEGKSSTALSLWAMTATVGPIAGPALGGWITDSYSWSWIFYINIPVGLFAAAVTWIDLPRPRNAARKRADRQGRAALLIAWVASLQIMLDKGKDLDWFISPVIVVLGDSSRRSLRVLRRSGS